MADVTRWLSEADQYKFGHKVRYLLFGKVTVSEEEIKHTKPNADLLAHAVGPIIHYYVSNGKVDQDVDFTEDFGTIDANVSCLFESEDKARQYLFVQIFKNYNNNYRVLA